MHRQQKDCLEFFVQMYLEWMSVVVQRNAGGALLVTGRNGSKCPNLEIL